MFANHGQGVDFRTGVVEHVTLAALEHGERTGPLGSVVFGKGIERGQTVALGKGHAVLSHHFGQRVAVLVGITHPRPARQELEPMV